VAGRSASLGTLRTESRSAAARRHRGSASESTLRAAHLHAVPMPYTLVLTRFAPGELGREWWSSSLPPASEEEDWCTRWKAPFGALRMRTARALLRLEKPTPTTHLRLTLIVVNRHPGQVHLASSSPRVKLAPHVRPNLHDQSRTWDTPLKECTSHDPERLPRYRQARMIAHPRLESSLHLMGRSAAFDRTGSPRASAVDHVSGTPGGSWLARLDTTRLATTRAIHARYVRPDSAIDHFIMCTRASPALGEGLLRARGTFDPETPNLRGCPRGPDQGHRWFMPPISLRRIVPRKPCEHCPLAKW
jgi:hypothetical protein